MKVYQNVNAYLERNNISESDLSRLTGIPEKTIHLKLTGKKALYIDDVVCFCKALNVPLEVFNYMSEYRQGTLKEIMEIIEMLSDKNLRRLIFFARGLTKNGD